MNITLEKIIEKLYNITGRKQEKPKKQIKEWVICSGCKYRGTLEEFLQADRGDTRCPRCGEDVSIFEL